MAETLGQAAVQKAIAGLLDISAEKRDFSDLRMIGERNNVADPFEKFLFEVLQSFSARPLETLKNLETVETSKAFGPFERMCVRSWRLFLTSEPLGVATHSEKSGASVFQFWSQMEVPVEIAEAVSAWQRLFGPNHKLFHLSDAVSYLRSEYGPTEAKILCDAPHPAIQADLFRLAYLAASGGVYVDADTFPRSGAKGVIGSMAKKDVLTFETTRPRMHIQNALISARPGSRYIADCATEAFQRVRRMVHPVQALAGGYLMTDIATRKGVEVVAKSITARYASQHILAPVKRSYGGSELDWRVWDERRLSGSADLKSKLATEQ